MCRFKKEIELKQKAKKETNKGIKEELKIEAGMQKIESDESDVEFDDTSIRGSEERKKLYPTSSSDSSSTLVTIT